MNDKTPTTSQTRLLSLHAERVADASTIGSVVHRLLAYLALSGGGRPPAMLELRSAGLALIGRERSISQRQALRTSLSMAGIYLQCFWPPRARLVGAGVVWGESEFDLIWRRSDGCFQVDEIKTGMFAAASHGPTVEQARKQAHDAAIMLGDAFSGVRVVLLRQQEILFVAPSRPARHGR